MKYHHKLSLVVFAGIVLALCLCIRPSMISFPGQVNMFTTRSTWIGLQRLYDARARYQELVQALKEPKLNDDTKKQLLNEQHKMLARFTQFFTKIQNGKVINSSDQAERAKRFRQALPNYFITRDRIAATQQALEQATTPEQRASLQSELDALNSNLSRIGRVGRLTILSGIDWSKPLPEPTASEMRAAQAFIAQLKEKRELKKIK